MDRQAGRQIDQQNGDSHFVYYIMATHSFETYEKEIKNIMTQSCCFNAEAWRYTYHLSHFSFMLCCVTGLGFCTLLRQKQNDWQTRVEKGWVTGQFPCTIPTSLITTESHLLVRIINVCRLPRHWRKTPTVCAEIDVLLYKRLSKSLTCFLCIGMWYTQIRVKRERGKCDLLPVL